MVNGTGTQTNGRSTVALFVLVSGGGYQAAICTICFEVTKESGVCSVGSEIVYFIQALAENALMMRR